MKDMCGGRGDRPCLRTKRKGGGAVSELTWQENLVIQEGRMGRVMGVTTSAMVRVVHASTCKFIKEQRLLFSI
jgi:hypothetical protein